MKVHSFLFLFGVAFGLFLSAMYSKLLIDVPLPPVSKQPAVELKKEVEKQETSYAKRFDSLKKQSHHLEVALIDAKASLAKAKQNSRKLKLQVCQMIENGRYPIDSIIGNAPYCDSLVVAVEYLMQSSVEKDSLYEKVTVNLEDQLKNKDSTISLKDEQYAVVKTAFNKSLANQEVLVNQNKLLNKQVRKQKLKSKILSAVLLMVTGAAANHLFSGR